MRFPKMPLCEKCGERYFAHENHECEAVQSSDLLGSHVSIPVMIDGQRATITADPNMPAETRHALRALVIAASKLTKEDLDRIAKLERIETAARSGDISTIDDELNMHLED